MINLNLGRESGDLPRVKERCSGDGGGGGGEDGGVVRGYDRAATAISGQMTANSYLVMALRRNASCSLTSKCTSRCWGREGEILICDEWALVR